MLLATPKTGNLVQSSDLCLPENSLPFPLGPCCSPSPTSFLQPLATSLQPKATAWQIQPPAQSEWMVFLPLSHPFVEKQPMSACPVQTLLDGPHRLRAGLPTEDCEAQRL